MQTLKSMMNTLPQVGSVEWIAVRSERRQPMSVVERIQVHPKQGIIGDRYQGRSGNRQVTLIQAEHIPVIASLCGYAQLEPELFRRNIVVRGVNLLAFREKTMVIGDIHLQITGLCHPCSRMESLLGPGGYNAMRGHGGLTARVLNPGYISIGAAVQLEIENLA